jgi:hypothetical protein
MYVCHVPINAGISVTTPSGKTDDYAPYSDWADPRKFHGLFRAALVTEDGKGLRYRTVTDDNGSRLKLNSDPDPKRAGYTFLTSGAVGHLFFAKDKSTLAKGLGVLPPAVRVSGPDCIGYFTGAYDAEGFGGTITAKIKTIHVWNNTYYGQNMQHEGESFTHFAQRANRGRLLNRGYYLILGAAAAMTGIKRKVGLIDNAVSLASLGSLIKGRMTQEEAVDKLMEDLLM